MDMTFHIFDMDKSAKRFASDKLLELKNTEWADEKSITEEEFIKRLTLTEIEVKADKIVMWYATDLFDGHSVFVTCDILRDLDMRCTPIQANIAG